MSHSRAAGNAVLLLALPTGAFAPPAAAQIGGSIQAHWGSEADFGIGARAIVDLGSLLGGVEAVGSFDYFFPGPESGVDLTYWEGNANFVYRIPANSGWAIPYLGTGFNLTRFEASTHTLGVDVSGRETEVGLNLLGGVIFELGLAKPFIEGRVTAGDGGQQVLTVGVRT